MLERVKTEITRMREESPHLPLIHKHTRACDERNRDFLLSLHNDRGQIERLQKRFEGSEIVDLENVRVGILDKDNILLNQAYVNIPNQGFIPIELESEVVRNQKYIGSLWADVIFADSGLKHISPQVRRTRELVTMDTPGSVNFFTDGHYSPIIRDAEAFNGSTIFLERKQKKGKFDGAKWTLKIRSVQDLMAKSD